MDEKLSNAVQWVEDHNIIMPQYPEELDWLWDQVYNLRPSVIVEIGSMEGGSFYVLSHACNDGSLVISIELPYGDGNSAEKLMMVNEQLKAEGYDSKVILGDSKSSEVLDELKNILNGRSIDFLFIDGDHTYEGVKSDWNNYSQFLREKSLVGFHDLMDPPYIPEDQAFQVFNELKPYYVCQEKIVKWGVGVLLYEKGKL